MSWQEGQLPLIFTQREKRGPPSQLGQRSLRARQIRVIARLGLSCSGSLEEGGVFGIKQRYHRLSLPQGSSSGGHLSSRFFGPEAWGPLAAAWVAFWAGHEDVVLWVRSDDASPEPMPVSIFFRSGDDLRPIDREALARVRGRVLDGGAGVGSLALILQERGVPVIAAEIIPEGVAIMKERGVREVIGAPLEALQLEGAFDTILLLMNGTALAGTLRGFSAFLDTLDGLLAPGGQILMDSTDLLAGEAWAESRGGPGQAAGGSQDGYPGELHYQMEFRGERGAPFPQLFLDQRTLVRLAGEMGWRVEVVRDYQGGEYLACLTRQEPAKTTV